MAARRCTAPGIWCWGRQVALKVLHPCLADDEESIARFRREAISAAGLRHRNIVGVYDRGEWAGTHYIAMEHVPGRTLRSLIREQAPLAPARAIELVLQVLRATGCMHRGGIIHRDLKPDNAIVDADGQLKLTDFGTARGGESDITKTGTLIGTAHYVSPEQAEGRAAGIPSDLYSVGIILYELLTGRVPFEGETVVSVLLKHVTQRPVPPSTFNAAVTSELDAIVLRALAKKPKARFGNAAAFIAALEHARATAAASGPADAMLADGRGAIVSGYEPPGVEAPRNDSPRSTQGIRTSPTDRLATEDARTAESPEPTSRAPPASGQLEASGGRGRGYGARRCSAGAGRSEEWRHRCHCHDLPAAYDTGIRWPRSRRRRTRWSTPTSPGARPAPASVRRTRACTSASHPIETSPSPRIWPPSKVRSTRPTCRAPARARAPHGGLRKRSRSVEAGRVIRCAWG